MIKVNGRDHEWNEGLTVNELLKIKRYTYPKIIVKINNKLVPKHAYTSTLIHDKDDVQVIHLLAGG
ncbi:sulfur carrier protein ThiS [Brassicibacter mesophilus]|uniref:sulfur carrier protein ThiS n=1 Tax=Brassicibacter mesophilus TaxID=745119 RepID=UPI003D19F313